MNHTENRGLTDSRKDSEQAPNGLNPVDSEVELFFKLNLQRLSKHNKLLKIIPESNQLEILLKQTEMLCDLLSLAFATSFASNHSFLIAFSNFLMDTQFSIKERHKAISTFERLQLFLLKSKMNKKLIGELYGYYEFQKQELKALLEQPSANNEIEKTIR